MTNDLKLIAPTEPTAAGKEGEREGEKGQVGQVGRWRCGGVGTVSACMNGWTDGRTWTEDGESTLCSAAAAAAAQ